MTPITILLLLFSIVGAQQPTQLQTGTISGRLLNTEGAPAAGIRIAVTPAEDDLGDGTLSNLDQTDAEGRYRLEGVLPGRYLILAGTLSIPSYFPGVTVRDQGQVVTLASGQVIANLDFRLAAVSVQAVQALVAGSPNPRAAIQQAGGAGQISNLHVSGRVVNTDSKSPYMLAQVWLRPGCDIVALPSAAGGLVRYGLPPARIVEPAADGFFDFDGVQPGVYCLSVGFAETRPKEIKIVDKSISDVQLEVTPNIDGRVVMEGSGALPHAVTLKYGRGACVETRGPCTMTVTSLIAPDGTFRSYRPPNPTYLIDGTAERYTVTSIELVGKQGPVPRAGSELTIKLRAAY